MTNVVARPSVSPPSTEMVQRCSRPHCVSTCCTAIPAPAAATMNTKGNHHHTMAGM